MSIQSTGSTTPVVLSPINRDPTVRRDSTSSPSSTAPIETQKSQASTQDKPIGNSSSDAVKKEELAEHLNKINAFVQGRASNVQFVTDEDTGLDIVKVVDTSTKEVIRQMPTQEAVQIAKALDHLKGLLIRQKA